MRRVRAGTGKSGDFSRLLACLSRMGMTPSDRSKVGIVGNQSEQTVDPWEEFAVELGQQPSAEQPN
jgi:hypothetical protein